jgi:acetylornithine deacetylase/succinyl-diaminopimelate desuccinylase-like protein
MTTSIEYAETHKTEFIEELKEFLRIPSISTLSEHKFDMQKAAEWLRDHCLSLGMTRAEVLPTGGHPVVYAEWMGAGDAQTVLVYGHYDVQPVDDPRNEWTSPPFEPQERDGKLFARGATDDKGQLFIQLKVFEAYMKSTGSFPVNLKVMFEGEEESGSPNLEPFVEKHKELLRCDVVVISDSHAISETQPKMDYGLRGLLYMELHVTGPRSDLHSGMYGGVVHNPVQAIAEIVAKLHNEDGIVTVPGFYDDVATITEEESALLNASPENSAAYIIEKTGVPAVWGDPGFSVVERLGVRPTLEINGIIGGWTGEGSKTVIGARAMAKISCRLAPHQDPDRVLKQIQDYVATVTPPTVHSEIDALPNMKSPAALVPIDSREMKLAMAAYKETFGNEPILTRSGGSIPVVGMYQQILSVPVLLMGFGLPDDNLHAPNEKMTVSMFHKGVKTMLRFYDMLATRPG